MGRLAIGAADAIGSRMLTVLYQPLSACQTFLLTVAVVLGVTLYCLAYTALTGVAESPFEGILWASVNVVPFLLAFEALKRVTGLPRQALVLVVALAVSVGLDVLIFDSGGLGFET